MIKIGTKASDVVLKSSDVVSTPILITDLLESHFDGQLKIGKTLLASGTFKTPSEVFTPILITERLNSVCENDFKSWVWHD